jgi:hypothetical protein
MLSGQAGVHGIASFSAHVRPPPTAATSPATRSRGALHHSAGRYPTVTLPIATSLSLAMSMQTGRSPRNGHDRQPLLQRSQRADSRVGAGRASLNPLVGCLSTSPLRMSRASSARQPARHDCRSTRTPSPRAPWRRTGWRDPHACRPIVVRPAGSLPRCRRDVHATSTARVSKWSIQAGRLGPLRSHAEPPPPTSPSSSRDRLE